MLPVIPVLQGSSRQPLQMPTYRALPPRGAQDGEKQEASHALDILASTVNMHI